MSSTKKKNLRNLAYRIRNAQAEKGALSDAICHQFITQPEYQKANTIMWYLHCRSEVRTLQAVKAELASSKRIIIPYCTKDLVGNNKLGLWLLENLDELKPGTWGILEPDPSRWGEPGKEIPEHELDLIMVPGVAFDLQGGRLGNGAGYYDRLLQKVRPETQLTAICYESQLFDHIVMEKHDVYMNAIITEKQCYKLPKRGYEQTG